MIKTQTLQEGVTPSPFTFGVPAAQSCMVDNYSNSTLYIADAGVFVPPFNARQIALPTPQITVNVIWQAPPGQTNPLPSGGTATIQWTDSSGPTTLATPIANFASPVHLLTAPGPFVASPESVVVTPPPGTNTLIVVTSNNVQFQVAGNTSGQFYLNDANPRPNGVAFVPIDLGTDASYTVYVFFSGTLGNIYVDASFVVQSVAIENVPLAVNIQQVDGSNLTGAFVGTDLERFSGIPVNTNSVGNVYRTLVAGSQVQEEVFIRPTFHLAVNAYNLVANVGQNVIAAPGVGSSIVVRKVNISVAANPAGGVTIELGTASGGATLGRWQAPTGVAAYPGQEEKGFAWDDYLVGDNLPVVITGTAAIGVEVILSYGIVTTANWPQE